MSKSAEAFRTISEVSQILDVAPHVLRFWEQKFPQIKPMKRGGGRRFYRPEDIALIAGIQKMLRDEGLTIRGARQRIADQGVAAVQETGRQKLGPSDSVAPSPDRAKATPKKPAPPRRHAEAAKDDTLPLFAQSEAPAAAAAAPPKQAAPQDPLARLAMALARCEALTAAPTAREAAPELVGRISQLARDLRSLG